MDNHTRHSVSICIAVILHLILLFVHFDFPITSIKDLSYSIDISTSAVINNSKDKIGEVVDKNNTTVKSDDKSISDPKKDISYADKSKIEDIKSAEVSPIENSVIDPRGMYDSDLNSNKKADARLDIVGWEWDSVPNPKDNTSEIGKIIFQIIVDSDGFVVGIKEVEKTVSPELASIYKEALAKLSFVKNSDNVIDKDFTKGTVTFIINAK